jgi:predicted phosphodiesterase
MPWWRWKSGRVTPEQAASVQRVLGGASPSDVRLLALHHPPFAEGLARLVGRSRLSRALRAARADVVLAGHTHVPSVQVIHDLVVVTAGTATSHRVRDIPRSWSLLRITREAVEVHERYESEPGAWHTGRMVRCPRRR